ncbi:glycosyltransferase [Persicobacter psychrovividus]
MRRCIMERPKVLLFTEYFAPAYKGGGPIQSCVNLVRYLAQAYDFYVVCQAFDLDKSPLGVPFEEWVDFEGKAQVFYGEEQKYSDIKAIIDQVKPDVVYVNGVFNLFTTLFPLLSNRKVGSQAKVIIAPRGMLQLNSLKIKRLKKRLYLEVLKQLLPKNLMWQFTTQQEQLEFRTLRLQGLQSIVGNVPNISIGFSKGQMKSSEAIKLVTVALISPMKNHLLVIEALKNVKGNVQWDIYGPVKDSQYWNSCQETINRLPKNIIVNYHGEVKPTRIGEVLKKANVYIQPSQSENFGHSLFEAFANGLPVISSNQTPWRNLKEKKAGWDVVLEGNELQIAIEEAISMDSETFGIWQKGARAVAEQYMSEANLKEEYGRLFG